MAARTTVARQEERRLGTGDGLSIDGVSRPRLEPSTTLCTAVTPFTGRLTCEDAAGPAPRANDSRVFPQVNPSFEAVVRCAIQT